MTNATLRGMRETWEAASGTAQGASYTKCQACNGSGILTGQSAREYLTAAENARYPHGRTCDECWGRGEIYAAAQS